MPEDPEEKALEELHALMARNAEAIDRLRTMLERLEFTLSALAAQTSERLTASNEQPKSESDGPGDSSQN
jgi:hypothetical protein